MAVDHYTQIVGTTATRIVKAPAGVGVTTAYITNHDNAALYIGDSSVTINDGNWGFTIVKDGNYAFDLASNDEIWAVSATSANVTVLMISRQL
jgi:hypothetical protein